MNNVWQTKTLGETCRFIDYRGKTPEKTTSGLRLITAKNVKMGFIQQEPLEYVAPESYDRWMTRGIPQKGDVLFTTEAPLANVAQLDTDERVVFAQRIIILQPEERVLDRPFLKYLLLSDFMQRQILEKGTGVTVQGIKASILKGICISFPSIAEQQRIAGILDEAFDGIATAKTNAEKNLQNARALLEGHLQAVFAEAYHAGELVTLAELAMNITDGDHLPPPKAPSGVPFITIGNIVKDSRTIDFSETFMVPTAYFDALKPHRKPKKGDVLYTVTGSYGIPVLVTENHDFCFQRHIGIIRPKPDVDSEWLCYLLESPQVSTQANEVATGTAQKTVSLKALRGYKVPRVPLAIQRETVIKLNSVRNETYRLKSIYQRKLATLEELKKSLLDQAFTGQL